MSTLSKINSFPNGCIVAKLTKTQFFQNLASSQTNCYYKFTFYECQTSIKRDCNHSNHFQFSNLFTTIFPDV